MVTVMEAEVIRGCDIFCGAGGSSAGASAAGVEIVAGVDMCSTATATFAANFPHGARRDQSPGRPPDGRLQGADRPDRSAPCFAGVPQSHLRQGLGSA